MPKYATAILANELTNLVSSIENLIAPAMPDITHKIKLRNLKKLIDKDADGLVNLNDITGIVFYCLKYYADKDTSQFREFISQVTMPTDSNQEMFVIFLDVLKNTTTTVELGKELMLVLIALQNPNIKYVEGIQHLVTFVKTALNDYIERLINCCSADIIRQALLQTPELGEYIFAANRSIKVIATNGEILTVGDIIEEAVIKTSFNDKIENEILNMTNLQDELPVALLDSCLYKSQAMQDRLFLDARFKNLVPYFMSDESNAKLRHFAATGSDKAFDKFIRELINSILLGFLFESSSDRYIDMLEIAILHNQSLTQAQKQAILKSTIKYLISNSSSPTSNIAVGKMQQAIRLLDLLDDPNVDINNRKLWHVACMHDGSSYELLRKYLLQREIDINCLDSDNNSFIQVVINTRHTVLDSVLKSLDEFDLLPTTADLQEILRFKIHNSEDPNDIDICVAQLRASSKDWDKHLINRSGQSIWETAFWETALRTTRSDVVSVNLARYIKSLGLSFNEFLNIVVAVKPTRVGIRLGALLADKRLSDPNLFVSGNENNNLLVYLAEHSEVCEQINTDYCRLSYALTDRKVEQQGVVKYKPHAITNEEIFKLIVNDSAAVDPISIAANNRNFAFYILLLREFKDSVCNFKSIVKQIHEVLSAMIEENISIDPMLAELRKQTNSYNPFKSWRCLSWEATLLQELATEISTHGLAEQGKAKLKLH